MKKSELEAMSIDNLRKEASKLKIKNYVKLPKGELIETILKANKDLSDEPNTEDLPALFSLPENEPEVGSEIKTLENTDPVEVVPVSLEDGSEVTFTDYVGEEHVGVILKKDGIKYKIKAQDDGVVYSIVPIRIKGYIEPVAADGESEVGTVYTDKLNKKLTVGQRCNSRINGAWKEGTVIDFKQIAGEDYVSVQLDENPLSKLVNCADIIGLSVKAGKDSNPTDSTDKPKKEIKITPKKDGAVTLSDQIREALLKGEEKPSEIAKRLGCRPQFVHNVKSKLN